MATTHLLRSRSARRCRTRMTMVCQTHEMGFAPVVADPVVFMAEGRSMETTPSDQYLRRLVPSLALVDQAAGWTESAPSQSIPDFGGWAGPATL